MVGVYFVILNYVWGVYMVEFYIVGIVVCCIGSGEMIILLFVLLMDSWCLILILSEWVVLLWLCLLVLVVLCWWLKCLLDFWEWFIFLYDVVFFGLILSEFRLVIGVMRLFMMVGCLLFIWWMVLLLLRMFLLLRLWVCILFVCLGRLLVDMVL